MPDVSQLTAVVAAAFGGSAFGHGVTVLLKRSEFRREDRARWLAVRQEAYAEYLLADFERVRYQVLRAGTALVSDEVVGPPEPIADVRRAAGTIMLVAPRRVADAAEVMGALRADLDAAVWVLLQMPSADRESDRISPILKRHEEAVSAFRQVARSDLQVDVEPFWRRLLGRRHRPRSRRTGCRRHRTLGPRAELERRNVGVEQLVLDVEPPLRRRLHQVPAEVGGERQGSLGRHG